MAFDINPNIEIEHICRWTKSYFTQNGNPTTKAIIGMSGGKDSTIAAALLCKAIGPERVYGVIMPDGEMEDKVLAIEICEKLGMEYEICDIQEPLKALYSHTLKSDYSEKYAVKTNTPARIRMTVLYAIAAAIGGRVVNTCNYSEDYVGFSTKYGDLAGDFSIFKNYPVRWVRMIGEALELPLEWIYKVPSDGMCGSSDESVFGFTYEILDKYLIENVLPEDEKIFQKIQEMHNRNRHKEVINLPAPKSGLV